MSRKVFKLNKDSISDVKVPKIKNKNQEKRSSFYLFKSTEKSRKIVTHSSWHLLKFDIKYFWMSEEEKINKMLILNN